MAVNLISGKEENGLISFYQLQTGFSKGFNSSPLLSLCNTSSSGWYYWCNWWNMWDNNNIWVQIPEMGSFPLPPGLAVLPADLLQGAQPGRSQRGKERRQRGKVCVSSPLGWGAPAFVLRSAYWTNQGQLSHNPNFGSIFLRNASTVKGPVYHTLLIKCFLGSHFLWIQERRKSLSWSQGFLVNIFFYVCVSMCTWTYTHKCIHKYTYSHIYREGKKYVQTLEICTAKYQQWLSVSDRTMTRFYFLPICTFIFSQ